MREEVSDMYDAEIILGKMMPWLVTWDQRQETPRYRGNDGMGG